MRKTFVVVLSLSMICTACSTAWVLTLDSILASAAPALINILQIVAVANGQPVNLSLETKISADSTLIETLAGDFAKASSESAPGVCKELQAAIGVYQADEQLVLQGTQVSDPNTQTKITLLSSLVAGTASAIIAVIPSCGSVVSPQSMKPVPPYRISTFAADYNRILLAPTGNTAVDAATQRLKLRQHSKIVEWATFGRLR